jgi:hypothetical protein
LGLDELPTKLREIALGGLVPYERIHDCLTEGWGEAARKLIEAGPICEQHEERLSEFKDRFSLTHENLDKNHSYSMVIKSAALRDLFNGKIPERVQLQGDNPFNFQKGEKLVWGFPFTKYYEDRTQRKYIGSSRGFSAV